MKIEERVDKLYEEKDNVDERARQNFCKNFTIPSIPDVTNPVALIVKAVSRKAMSRKTTTAGRTYQRLKNSG